MRILPSKVSIAGVGVVEMLVWIEWWDVGEDRASSSDVKRFGAGKMEEMSSEDLSLTRRMPLSMKLAKSWMLNGCYCRSFS